MGGQNQTSILALNDVVMLSLFIRVIRDIVPIFAKLRKSIVLIGLLVRVRIS